jgi:hypothetical protein
MHTPYTAIQELGILPTTTLSNSRHAHRPNTFQEIWQLTVTQLIKKYPDDKSTQLDSYFELVQSRVVLHTFFS